MHNRVFAILAVVSLLLSSLAFGQSKRRAIFRVPGVDSAVFVLYGDPDGNGKVNVLVGLKALSPAVAGTSYRGVVMWPGADEYVTLPRTTLIVPKDWEGGNLSGQLFYGEEFTDENGIPRPAGEARFGLEVISPSGVRTFAWAGVEVPVNPEGRLSPGVLKAVSKGTTILLLSTTSPPPKVALIMILGTQFFVTGREVSRSGEIDIPENWTGTLFVTVPQGYPEARCATIPVN